MLESGLSNSIKIHTRRNISVQSGDFVLIQVIKKLSPQKWAIGYNGVVYPAISDVELTPGQILRVRALKDAGSIHFKISSKKEPVSSPVLNHFGLQDDPLSKWIVTVLMKNEMPLSSNNILQIKKILKKIGKDDIKFIGLLVQILGKDISLSSLELKGLTTVMDFGKHGQGASGGEEKKKDKDPTPERVKKAVSEGVRGVDRSDNNPLPVFNHLKGKDSSWIILPFKFHYQEGDIAGSIRILRNNYNKSLKKMVLIVHGKDNWSFYISREKKIIRVMVFSDKWKYIKDKGKNFEEFIVKMRKLGIHVDETIYDDNLFDGFYPVFTENLYKSVDTVI